MARPWPAVPFIINSIASPISVADFDSDYAQLLTDFNDSSIGYVNYAADTGTANNYIVTLASPPSAYIAGMTVVTTPVNTNTGASVINVSALGSKAIVDAGGNPLKIGALWAGRAAVLVYTGINFQLVQNGSQPMTFAAVNPGLSFTADCSGANDVSIYVTQNTGAGLSILITNLAFGVPVTVTIVNTSAGSTQNYNFTVQDPTGAAYATVNICFPTSTSGAGLFDLTLTKTLAIASAIIFSGVSGTNVAGAGVLFMTV